jgi:hypothetical protein
MFCSVGGLPNITADGLMYLSNFFFEDPMEHNCLRNTKRGFTKQFEIVGDTSLVLYLPKSKLLRGIKKGTSSIEIQKIVLMLQ